eukprot:528806_1
MQLEDAFSFFTQLNDIEREKSRNLLIKICKNILNEPNNEKYRDLNFMKMSKKFAKCTICMELLLSVGFEKSIDGQRLKLNNTTELNKLHTLHNKLTNVTEVTNVTSHTMEEAKQAVDLSVKNESKDTTSNVMQTKKILIEINEKFATYVDSNFIQYEHKKSALNLLVQLLDNLISNQNSANSTNLDWIQFALQMKIYKCDSIACEALHFAGFRPHVGNDGRIKKLVWDSKRAVSISNAKVIRDLLASHRYKLKHSNEYNYDIIEQLIGFEMGSKLQIMKAMDAVNNRNNTEEIAEYLTMHQVTPVFGQVIQDNSVDTNYLLRGHIYRNTTPANTKNCEISQCAHIYTAIKMLELYDKYMKDKQTQPELDIVTQVYAKLMTILSINQLI